MDGGLARSVLVGYIWYRQVQEGTEMPRERLGKVQAHWWIRPHVKAKVQELARRERRLDNEQVELLLEKAMAMTDSGPGPASPEAQPGRRAAGGGARTGRREKSYIIPKCAPWLTTGAADLLPAA